jgi:putative uncharacterized protein (fragment)
MKKIVLYFTLLTFSLYSCHTDYKSKIDYALQNGYDELAINYLNKAIEEAPTLEYLYMRANCQMRIGKYENALRDYTRLLQYSSTEMQEIDSYINISKDSIVNINSIYENQLSAYYHLGRIDSAENKLIQLSSYFDYYHLYGQKDYWNGLIAKEKGNIGDAYCYFLNATKEGYTKALAELKEIAKNTGRPSEIPLEIGPAGIELQFTDGTKWGFGKQLKEIQKPIKVEKKRIIVDYVREYILMNFLNKNALKYIPGMRNKEKQAASVCLAYMHNKIIRIIKLPNSKQLTNTLLEKYNVCLNDYTLLDKPLILDVWVLKYQNTQGEKTCELYLI